MKKFEFKRYDVRAKRKDTNEKWTEWTNVDNYRQAEKHACHAEELGFTTKIVVMDKAVEELRGIFGNSYESADYADAVLDAGFCKRNEVIKEIMSEVEEMINCHASGDIDDSRLYILFEKLKKKYNF